MKHAAEESLKEFMRVALGGFVTTIAPYLLTSVNTVTGKITVNMGILTAISFTLFITSLARAADKFVHEWNKEKHPEMKGQSMGIMRW